MINAITKKIFPSKNENLNPNSFSSSQKYQGYEINNFQNINSFFPDKAIQKKNSNIYLNTQENQFTNIKSLIPSFEINLSNNTIYNSPLYTYNYEYNHNKRNDAHKYHSSERYNTSNYSSDLSGINHFNGIMHSNTNYFSNSIDKYKINKISSPYFLEKNMPPKRTVIQYDKSNYRNEFYSNEKSLTNSNNNFIDLTKNNTNYVVNNNISLGNSIQNYIQDEPSSNFKLSEFTIIKEIGKGANGTIYVVNWKKNNKNYALKKGEIIFEEELKRKIEEINLLKEFKERTGLDGVIKIYGHLCTTNKFGTHYLYELMELADKNWEEEILNRGEKKLYYQEYELMDIFITLIKTFSALQTIHFIHRDINPQNIMRVNGRLKICDFGNSRVLKKKGTIVQRIRGSEIFMSPIVFKAYHSDMKAVKHNCYKSDVFSLGMCFLLAASLDYEVLSAIREIYDMNIINKILNKYLGKRYSPKVTNLLINMLQIEENTRPDFYNLELFMHTNLSY